MSIPRRALSSAERCLSCWPPSRSRAAAPRAQLSEGKNYARIANPQPVETGQEDRGHRILLVRLPALRRARAVSRRLAREAAARRRVPARPGDVPAALGAAREDLLHARRAGRRSRSCRPTCSRRSTARARALWDNEEFFDWAASKGLDRKKVEEVFTSFAIDGKMKRAMQLAQQYNIQSVPTVVVDGKFVTSSDRVGTHAQLPRGDRRARRQGARRAPEELTIVAGPRRAHRRASSSPARRRASARRWRATTPRSGATRRPVRAARRRARAHRGGARARARRHVRRRRSRCRGARACAAAISSRASARPTSSSPTPASRAAR